MDRRNEERLVNKQKIAPYIPVIDKSKREDGTFSREDFVYDEVRDVYTCPAGKNADHDPLHLHRSRHPLSGLRARLPGLPTQGEVLFRTCPHDGSYVT
jgi:hypothetical protein